MPRGDGTGPMGQGPMTGRQAGFCAGYNMPGYTNPGAGMGYFGRGRGFYGRGGGMGFRNRYYATGLTRLQRASIGMPAFNGGAYEAEITPKQEADILSSQADALKNQLDEIQARIEVLKKSQAEKNKQPE
jgi:hypothetical protein